MPHSAIQNRMHCTNRGVNMHKLYRMKDEASEENAELWVK